MSVQEQLANEKARRLSVCCSFVWSYIHIMLSDEYPRHYHSAEDYSSTHIKRICAAPALRRSILFLYKTGGNEERDKRLESLKWSDSYSKYCCVGDCLGGSFIFTEFRQQSRGIAFTDKRCASAQKPHLVARWVYG